MKPRVTTRAAVAIAAAAAAGIAAAQPASVSGRAMRLALDSASRVVERGRWATIVLADTKATPIELVAGDGGRWLLGQ
jgi:hypothetical protein